jgi:large subunit ribosomal protein L20
MPRVKRGTVRRAKRKKLLGLAKGYYANKSKLYRAAKESVDTALKYAFVGRRRKKRDFRRCGSSASTPPRARTVSRTAS